MFSPLLLDFKSIKHEKIFYANKSNKKYSNGTHEKVFVIIVVVVIPPQCMFAINIRIIISSCPSSFTSTSVPHSHPAPLQTPYIASEQKCYALYEEEMEEVFLCD
jgi:hypothetical protein